ncbi:MAG: YfiR family protein [Bacteroidota bacterium]
MVQKIKNIASVIQFKITYGIIVWLFLLTTTNSNLIAQSNIEEYDVKKIMIFKITSFIEWPENSNIKNSQNPVIISIIGDNPFKGKLKKLATDQHKIKNKRVIVRNIQSIDEINGSNILFISSSERYDISTILKYTHNKAILTIGDAKGYTEKGVMIGLIQRGENIKFYINKKEADQCGFYISSQLLGNAIKVIK